MKIRKSTEPERKEILNIHNRAFGNDKGAEIAKLVDDLFDDETAMPLLSLVAVENNKLVGHVLFTKVVVTKAEKILSAQILAPLAILPDKQKKGIGEELINEGLRLLEEAGTELVFVLGHPTYYPRCGFIPAGAQGFDAPYPIPEEHAEAWMVQELRDDVLKRHSGTVQCSEVLNEPQHWRE
ncbi:MAG: N-acetyltransferase [Candidatus Electrothrix sp. GW3-4]|uniref:GNAT family N-acetyltransferase n=1 Tax=Candidatus Electrothrix sp. GW3-4 TaxID=3126740 RepID=UPI0030CB26B5